jgi:hypothetical protein
MYGIDSQRGQLSVALAACVAALGCGGPRVVPVSGVAMHAGKPVPNLLIHFEPADGKSSWGITDDEGRFTLTRDRDTQGAVTGVHTVWIEYDPAPADPVESIQTGLGQLPPRPKEIDRLLSRYGSAATSTKKVELKHAEAELVIEFE